MTLCIIIIAKRILDTLKSEVVTNLDSFCSECMFTESPSDDCKNNQFPQCGGKLVDYSCCNGCTLVLLTFYNDGYVLEESIQINCYIIKFL